ncbi:hypothetical protein KY360_07190 [Candidatus Woesearchaeota archaeon]|nr:hypothetical protein [Candidatus Woesearchaeota archaeon]
MQISWRRPIMFIQDHSFNFATEDVNSFIKKNNLEKKFVIALDFDGVISDPYILKTKYINEYGYNITEEQCGYDACIRKLGIKEKNYKSALERAYLADPKILPLQEGFKGNFPKLKRLKDAVLILVTSRYNYMIKHLENYLKFNKIKVDGIFHTELKNKISILRKGFVDVFVEDSPFKLKQIFDKLNSKNRKFFNSCTFILYRNKQNYIEKNPNKGIIEVKDWDNLYKAISKNYNKWVKSRG